MLRLYSNEDYLGVLALSRIVFPERRDDRSHGWIRDFEDISLSGGLLHRHVAVVGRSRRVIGFAKAWSTRSLRKFRMELVVHPDRRRNGIGGALLDRLLNDLHSSDALSLQARVREDRDEALAFLKRRGFEEVHRMVLLKLEVAQSNLSPLRSVAQQVTSGVIQIATLTEQLQHDPRCWEKLHDLHEAARLDWPDPDPTPDPEERRAFTLGEFISRTNTATLLPDGFFIAMLPEQYVGYSHVTRNEEVPAHLKQGNTAVRPGHRHRGIATALKVFTVEYALEHGFQAISTSSANPAMILINERLGFKRGLSEVRLVRLLKK